MGRKFEGLVLFLIGLTNLAVADALSHAETATLVDVGSLHSSIVGVSIPTQTIIMLGVVLIVAGILWAIFGKKIKL